MPDRVAAADTAGGNSVETPVRAPFSTADKEKGTSPSTGTKDISADTRDIPADTTKDIPTDTTDIPADTMDIPARKIGRVASNSGAHDFDCGHSVTVLPGRFCTAPVNLGHTLLGK